MENLIGKDLLMPGERRCFPVVHIISSHVSESGACSGGIEGEGKSFSRETMLRHRRGDGENRCLRTEVWQVFRVTTTEEMANLYCHGSMQ